MSLCTQAVDLAYSACARSAINGQADRRAVHILYTAGEKTS